MSKPIKKVDLIVGIPSFCEADSIGFVTKQVDLGIKKYFPKMESIIINIDNNSPDDTKTAFLSTKTKTPKLYLSTPKGVKGKGNNFHNLFRKVKDLKAKIVIVVDADLKSIRPYWIKYFAQPIQQGYDYATPIYARHKYDGTITNNICYPIVYALLGKNVRQPIGGDFSFSLKLAKYWLRQKWVKTTREYGIDIFMTTHAILGGFKTCQVGLGAKIHKLSAPKLGPMFLQVVETLFRNVLDNKEKWIAKKKVEQTEMFGLKVLGPAQTLKMYPEKIKKEALSAYDRKCAKKFLAKPVFEKVNEMFKQKKLNIDRDLWAKIVYDMLLAFTKVKNKSEVVVSLQALYFGRAYSFIQKTKYWSQKKAEEEILAQAKKFLELKPYLLERLLSNLT